MRNNIIFVGAGGTGMSWLAMMLYDIGYHNIICINDVETDLTDRLSRHGLKVIIWHGNYHIDFHDIVIYADVQSIIEWPELIESRNHQNNTTKKYFHICLSYAQFLAEISKLFITIGIAGSNGKTSTTAMSIYALSSLSKITTQHIQNNMTFWLWLLWWLLPNFNNRGYALSEDEDIRSDIFNLFEHILNQKHQFDYSLIKKHIFILEAGEYKDHYLYYDLDYTLITNIERDHRDYFPTWESYKESFRRVIDKTRYQVILTQQVLDILEIQQSEKILLSQPFPFENEYLIWSYNDQNAWMVKSISELLISSPAHNTDSQIQDNLYHILSEFLWAGRRMEYLGQWKWKPIYSDYWHHAPALLWNMKALQKKFPDHKICVVFQPHQAQRVLDGWDDFRDALKEADTTILYRLYTARENFQTLQSQYDHLSEISNFQELGEAFSSHLGWQYCTTIENLQTQLAQLSDDYLIVYFSAGDLDREIRKTLL